MTKKIKAVFNLMFWVSSWSFLHSGRKYNALNILFEIINVNFKHNKQYYHKHSFKTMGGYKGAGVSAPPPLFYNENFVSKNEYSENAMNRLKE